VRHFGVPPHDRPWSCEWRPERLTMAANEKILAAPANPGPVLGAAPCAPLHSRGARRWSRFPPGPGGGASASAHTTRAFPTTRDKSDRTRVVVPPLGESTSIMPTWEEIAPSRRAQQETTAER
jgi:hypothetical protein